MTTFKAFIDAVNDLEIDSVIRKFDHTPNTVAGGDLPAQYVTLPGGGLNTATLATCNTSGNARTCDLVVLVEAAGLGLTQDNQAAVIQILDEIEATLRTAMDNATIMPMIAYALVSDGNIVLGTDVYWGIVATITGEE